ncbi:MAG: hypothetical protein FWD26_07380 [Treponema sp.]|nr:hypothetical protein [Treponema sp.]
MQKLLNKLYSDFLSGEISRSDFEGSIYHFLFYNQDKTCLSHWESDEYEDYLSWFYLNLRKAIDSYRDVGSSFDAFMAKFILISSKEYRIRTKSKEITEYSTWSAQVPDMYVSEDTPVYIHKDLENRISSLIVDKKGRKNTRRILALIIKCYYYVSDDFAEKIAPRIGIKAKDLLEMLKKIRALRQKKDDKIYFMKECIYSQFFRCLAYEKKLSLMFEDVTAYKKQERKLDKARERLQRMRKRVTSIRKDATNNQVAVIIGTSKGTVDASLHRLKLQWNKMAKKAGLN